LTEQPEVFVTHGRAAELKHTRTRSHVLHLDQLQVQLTAMTVLYLISVL